VTVAEDTVVIAAYVHCDVGFICAPPQHTFYPRCVPTAVIIYVVIWFTIHLRRHAVGVCSFTAVMRFTVRCSGRCSL